MSTVFQYVFQLCSSLSPLSINSVPVFQYISRARVEGVFNCYISVTAKGFSLGVYLRKTLEHTGTLEHQLFQTEPVEMT